mmetsp:Transcript_4015/g.10397  ORF Transcript_4015/g.10397 Transcript_4015/m.10397 type:complete len:97 (-) Transcript_4015:174-464(-)
MRNVTSGALTHVCAASKPTALRSGAGSASASPAAFNLLPLVRLARLLNATAGTMQRFPHLCHPSICYADTIASISEILERMRMPSLHVWPSPRIEA